MGIERLRRVSWAIRASVPDSTMETQALKPSGTPFNAQGSLDEVDAALAPLKEVSAKAGMQVAPTSIQQGAPTSTQGAEPVSLETPSSASTVQSVKTSSPELKAVNSAAGQTSPLQSIDARPNAPTVANASSIAMSQDTTRAAAVTQSGAPTLKEASPKGRTPAPSNNGSLTETPIANSTGSANKEAATGTAVPALEQAKSSTIGQDSGPRRPNLRRRPSRTHGRIYVAPNKARD